LELSTCVQVFDDETCGKENTWKPRRRSKNNINIALRKWDGEDGLDSSGSG